MSLRTWTFGYVLIAMSFAPACAQRHMRTQAAVLAEAGATLERETAEFAAARSAVVRLRQRNLVERQQQTAELGQANARTVHYWKLASDPERLRQLALFDGLTAAAAAAAAVQDRWYEWEESVLARAHALTVDRAALHRFVQQLLILSSPPRFVDGARFYVEYGAVVGQQVDAGLKDVRATVSAAGASGSGGSSGGSVDLTGPGDLQGPTTPPTDPPRDPAADPPREPGPPGREPVDRTPPDQHRDPSVPATPNTPP